MIAVRCQSCARRFALFCLAPGDPCVFCGARQVVEITPQDAPPAVMEPPAIERVVITQRTTDIARGLVEQALGQESEP